MAKGFGKGRSPTKFSFTFEDYARLAGLSPAAVRKHAQRGKFNPSDLVSVLEFVRDRLTPGEPLEESTESTQAPARKRRLLPKDRAE